MKSLSSFVAVGAVFLLSVTGCTDPEPDGPAVVASVAPRVETIDCPAEAASPPTDWPLALPAPLVVTEYSVTGNTFRVIGISNNGEELLVSAVEETLRDYETSEPDGGPNDVMVAFDSARADGSLFMSDEEGAGCWDVDIQISFRAEPERSEFIPIRPEPESGVGPATGVGPGAPLGTGEITTVRGKFPLTLLSCALSPVLVEASAPEGELVLSESEGGGVSVLWTYADGSTVSDGDANSVVSSGSTGLFVGDGEGPDGPETLIVEITCD